MDMSLYNVILYYLIDYLIVLLSTDTICDQISFTTVIVVSLSLHRYTVTDVSDDIVYMY